MSKYDSHNRWLERQRQKQRTVDPWRCPKCGYMIKFPTCVACEIEERKRSEQKARKWRQVNA